MVRPVVVIGVSLGGAVALQAAAEDSRIAAVVAVATFSDIRMVSRTERAPFIASRADIDAAFQLAEQQAGFKADEASPVKAAERIRVPVFLIHGQADHETFPHADLGARCSPRSTARSGCCSYPGPAHNAALSSRGPGPRSTPGSTRSLRGSTVTSTSSDLTAQASRHRMRGRSRLTRRSSACSKATAVRRGRPRRGGEPSRRADLRGRPGAVRDHPRLLGLARARRDRLRPGPRRPVRDPRRRQHRRPVADRQRGVRGRAVRHAAGRGARATPSCGAVTGHARGAARPQRRAQSRNLRSIVDRVRPSVEACSRPSSQTTRDALLHAGRARQRARLREPAAPRLRDHRAADRGRTACWSSAPSTRSRPGVVDVFEKPVDLRRRRRARRRRLRGLRRRARAVREGQLPVGEADLHGPAVLELAEQDLVGERVADLDLHQRG